MNTRSLATFAAGAVALAAGFLFHSPAGRAQSSPPPPFDAAKSLKGFQIAPVPLNMQGRDPYLVGYGSYLVNAVADCNGCHSAGPATEFATGGNPYLGQKTIVNSATYLGGGRDFGAFPSATGNFPHIISRNLTPDASGLPEGGNTFDEFLKIMRNGTDTDAMHPTCTGAPDGKCLPAPFKGELLQIMPWFAHANMTDDDLRAIYEYLATIPCIEGGPGEPANRCGPGGGAKTAAVALPKNGGTINRQFQLDGSQSTAIDGKPLTFQWTIPQGSPQAGMTGANTATPIVQFGLGRGVYTFQLTVTDSAGKTATDTATVNFSGN
jgi:hypothetical protein